MAGRTVTAGETAVAGGAAAGTSAETTLRDVLPVGEENGTFVGRVWDPARGVPVPVAYRGTGLWDVSQLAGTSATLMERADLAAELAEVYATEPTWHIDEVRLPEQAASEEGTSARGGEDATDGGTRASGGASLGGASADGAEDAAPASAPVLLAPVDLQVLKACGVTFAGSMIERLIEERAQGDPARAQQIREEMQAAVGVDLSGVVPGSAEAAAVKEQLLGLGWWSQYLEVGLGPDPEVFTKGPVLSAVGTGDAIGIPAFSAWNNPEPELTLVVTAAGRIAGVTLGNDVNLRDVEGRSALLLGMAKDNNRSTALGPVIRVFDEGFTLDDARTVSIELTVEGAPEAAGGDGYVLRGLNTCGSLSRTFERLVDAALGDHHQYPDGCVILTGTLFAPTEDRAVPGEGFTHALGDRVVIENPLLGRLVNTVGRTEELGPWTYGVRALFADLARAGLRA